MKQSTKLLSLLLALVMAFSCMTVIGSALKSDVTKDKMEYDAVDDAIISAEQGATIILNYLDVHVMPGLGTMDLSVLGTLDLTSIDNALSSIYDLLDNGLIGAFALTIPDLGDLADGKSHLKDVQRSGGDLNVIYALLNFLGDDSVVGVVKKAPNGLLVDGGITLGWINGIVSGLVDLSSINEILTDIPGFATRAVFDMLVYGSYGYDKDAEDLGNVLPAEVDTIDEILDQAIGGLLSNPQDYEWVGEGEAAVKNWDMDSLVMPTAAKYGIDTVKSYFSVSDSSNTIFALIDKLAPFAIYDLGIQPLNNNLKKALMEAVEADVNEIALDKVPADAQAAFELDKEVGKESYVTYISYDKIFHSEEDGEWYYTTLGNKTVLGSDNLPVLDEEGNEQTEKVREFYKINMAAANEFAELINWDWELFAPEPLTGDTDEAENEINYEVIINKYGSIAQSLNHLVYIVFNNALTEDAKADFEATTGSAWLDGATSADAGNGKTVFVDNIERLLKYLLANYADKIFGDDSEYVDWEYSDVEEMSIVELVAHIGPTFFEDVMPQLIIPKNDEGRAAFHDGVQIVEFGALVLREFMTEIAPQANYDDYIFAEGTLTSAEGRQFAEHTADEWVNIILNMGMDVAVTYLTNLTNFNDFCEKSFGEGFNVSDYMLESAKVKDDVLGDARWKLILDNVILWAVEYVGTADRTGGVLNGINYNSVNAVDGPLNKLSFILNKILPLGFVNGCTSASYDLDVQMLFDRLMDLVKNFNLDALVGLFGRNTASSYNLFNTAPLVKGVLDLVNRILTLVLRTNLLPTTDSCAALLTNSNLSTIIETLLNALESIKVELLTSALPVVCKLVKIFGGEQEMGTPNISLDQTLTANGGSMSGATFNITNGSTGLWRGFRDVNGNVTKDNQYTYDIVGATAYNFDGTASSIMSGFSLDKTRVDYGDIAVCTYDVANVPTTGAIQRVEISYTVNDEDLNVMADGKVFTISKYIFITYNPTTTGQTADTGEQGISNQQTKVYYDFFVNNDPETIVDTINNTEASWTKREDSFLNGSATIGASPSTATIQGVTYPNSKRKEDSAIDGESSYFTVANADTLKAYAATPGSAITWSVDAFANSSSASFTQPVKMTFYDGTSLAKLSSVVDSEAGKMRKAAEYNTTSGTYSYADRLLRTSDWNDDQLQETTSAMTAWIDADENEYAESAVSDIVIATDDAGNVTGKTGFVTVDGKEVAVKFVTKLDNGTVWSNYTAALQAGIQGAWQVWNNQSVFDHKARYDALRMASTEVDFIKLSDEELALIGDNIDADVLALEAVLDESEATYSDTKDYTDYRMYRWNRYNDARDEAKDIINAYKATLRTTDDLNKYFPYTSIYPSELAKLVKGDQYENYINALLEDFDAETAARNAQDLENAKIHYSGYEAIDVAQAENLVTRMGPRLITRDHDVIATHLENEVASAKAMITDASLYTERSWVKYEAALAAAEALLADDGRTQMQIFDTKWELLTCRNELVYVEDEADYSELEELIAQAQTALANTSLYDNTNKEFGQVLAELGYHDFDGTQLFPGSALYVNTEPYDYNDQDIIDDAADALKEALARLKFKGLSITGANVSEGILSTDDAETEEVEATITATIATIAAEMDADAVKELFKVTADGVTVDKENITVSNDLYYTIDTALPGFAGTNSVVTFYTLQGDIKIPVATVRIVVEADVNGDGAVDVLDAAYENLVQTEKGKLEGCYLLAGDLAGNDRAITADDYSAVINAVKATA